jgi:hypothetical protein
MNKKTNRTNQRAPTAKPATSIAPSATLVLDGELPLSASHGMAAPEPLAAHDVLQAALVPLDTGAAAEPATDAPAPAPAAESPVPAPAPDAVAVAAPKGNSKKPAKAADQDAGAEVAAAPAKAAKVAKVAKEKFVKVSFSLPESEAGLLDALKKTHQGNGVAIKKSQLLRAGLLALADLDSEKIAKLLAHLPTASAAGKKKK